MANARQLDLKHLPSTDDVIIRNEFLGKGYGIIGEAEREAIRLTATTEGILLDPVYTGRAMTGLIAMIRSVELSTADTVLFWHTGGAPALFSYTSDLRGCGERTASLAGIPNIAR